MAARAPFEFDADQLWRLDVDDYHRMIEANILGEDDHVELLEGVLLSMPPHGPPHAGALVRLNKLLVRAAGDDLAVRCQVPLTLGRKSEPEPDFAIVPAAEAAPTDHHPATALLVIEVSDSSLRVDRLVKTRIYSAAGIPEYWIVDAPARAIEIYCDPDADRGVYRTLRTLAHGDVLTTPALPDLRAAVDQVFG